MSDSIAFTELKSRSFLPQRRKEKNKKNGDTWKKIEKWRKVAQPFSQTPRITWPFP
jgi:hypothetical protein